MPSCDNKNRVTCEYDSTDGKPTIGVRFHSVVPVTLGKGYAQFIIIEPIVPHFGVAACVCVCVCVASLSVRVERQRHSGRRYTFHWHSMPLWCLRCACMGRAAVAAVTRHSRFAFIHFHFIFERIFNCMQSVLMGSLVKTVHYTVCVRYDKFNNFPLFCIWLRIS